MNKDLLKKTLDYIETHPEEYDQTDFRTCFAAHAAMLAGGEWYAERYDVNAEYKIATEDDWPAYTRAGAVHVSHRARRLLGLTSDEAMLLYYSGNTLDDIRKLLAKWGVR